MIRNLKQFFFVAGLLLIAAGAQPLGAAVYQWSTTAANNATADPTINWSEGMSPSSVNDSARAMMAAIATARRDWQAVNAGGGTASALTYTSSQGFTSLAALDGQMISLVMPVTNGASPTLNVDGLGAKPITLDNSGAPLPAGTMVAATPYTLTYYNSLGGFFRLHNLPGNPITVPLGGIVFSSIATPPNANFVVANGQCISRTAFAAYFAAVGTAFGTCDGLTTFGVPDLSGRVAAGVDAAGSRLSNSAAGCGTSMATVGASCANGTQSKTLTLAQLPTGIQSANPAQAISVTSTNTRNIAAPTTAGEGVSFFSAAIGPGGNVPQSALNGAWSPLGPVPSSGSNNISVTSTNTSGNAFPSVQPTIALQALVRVL